MSFCNSVPEELDPVILTQNLNAGVLLSDRSLTNLSK